MGPSPVDEPKSLRVRALAPSEDCPGCLDIRERNFPFGSRWSNRPPFTIDTKGFGHTEEIHFCPVCGVLLSD